MDRIEELIKAKNYLLKKGCNLDDKIKPLKVAELMAQYKQEESLPIDSVDISFLDYEYEMFISDKGTPFEINSWIPIATDRIKDPSRINEYIEKGLIRKRQFTNEKEVHLKLSDVEIDNDNLDYIKMTGEICGKLRDDLVKSFAIENVKSQVFNDMEYQAEQNECANMYLDDLGIPKEDAAGEKYSTVGRIKYLEQNGF